MSYRPDPLSALSVPDGTTVEEHDIVAEADVIVGGQSTVELGIRARNVIAGERASFGGNIEAGGDCRLDMWCEIDGNVLVGGDAYLGARTDVGGQLVVAGDLDIGDDVTIEEGFEANGWIEIRNPMSTMVLLFVYLSHLLRAGEDDAAREMVSEVFDESGEHDPLVVPESASVGDDAWRVSTPARVGNDCRLHGNLRAAEISVGERNEVFGSLRARGPITVGANTQVHGDVTTRGGEVRIAPGARIRGDVSCEDLDFHEDAVIEGSIRARGEMSIARDSRAAGAARNSMFAPTSESDAGREPSQADDASEDETENTSETERVADEKRTENDPADESASDAVEDDAIEDGATEPEDATEDDGSANPEGAATNGSKPSFGTDQ